LLAQKKKAAAIKSFSLSQYVTQPPAYPQPSKDHAIAAPSAAQANSYLILLITKALSLTLSNIK
jgi:hypothetical protein